MIPESEGRPFSVSAISDKGKVRTRNEDYFGLFEPETDELNISRGVLAIVTDGMGGHFSGEEASRLAVQVMGESYFEETDLPAVKMLDLVFRRANAEVFEKIGSSRNGLAGTTCTAVAVFPDYFHIAHAGDSRVYMIRKGKIDQLTEDHSVVGEMFRKGMLDAEEARTHPRRNVITRAVGLRKDVKPDLYESIPFEEDDSILICSDGLYSMISDKEIEEIISSNDIASACGILVDKANKAGGSDNITLIIVRKGRS
ncbi:MAG: Stp1/IreP family PP2C-type Ser/Thr phosphatase [Candidatus Krumholzibacteriota bacterium]|nr:Stp1/IreP family PP2C-type Ser/Thr phosphatase [Candidatus Krumholzibacteriota bacterium]